MMKQKQIRAIMVSHNAPEFTELAVRSLLANHDPPLNMSLVVFDNASIRDTSALALFLKSKGIRFLQSGFDTCSKYCSHGEILQSFVGTHSDCKYYLFLDHDVCFYQANLIHGLMNEIETAEDEAFGIGPRVADWSGTKEWSSTELEEDRSRMWAAA